MELNAHDAGEVALAVRLKGAGQVTVRPVVGLTIEVRVTDPAKLNVLVRVTPTVRPVWPTLRLEPLAPTVKSPTWTVMVTELLAPALVPVVVTA